MPFTPYHFGLNGFLGLVFRRWLDMPMLVAANVLIDCEVLFEGLFRSASSAHQVWHFHTLLIGGLAGAAFGAAVYLIKPLRMLCIWAMNLLSIPYKPTLPKMALSGLLGAWLHVAIDSLYHYDVQIFWPFNSLPLYRLFGWRSNHAAIWTTRMCVVFWVLLVLMLIIIALKNRRAKKEAPK